MVWNQGYDMPSRFKRITTGFTVNELLSATGGILQAGSKDMQVNGISTDSRTISRDEAFVSVCGKKFDGANFIADALNKGSRCIIASQAFPAHLRQGSDTIPFAWINVRNTVTALNAIAAYHRNRFDIPVIAVTGSNGKTTTKEMIAHLLGGQYNILKNEGTKNNHIGVPHTLLQITQAHEAIVLELGTNHPGEIAFLGRYAQPTIAVITNIGPSHLEHFKNLERIRKEKTSLLNCLRVPACALYNADDAFLAPALRRLPRHQHLRQMRIGYGITADCEFRVRTIASQKNGIFFSIGSSPVRFHLKSIGRHNVYNALAAIAVARLLGLSYEEISRKLASFSLPAGRLHLKRVKDLCFIDDTYNANPLSASHALNALQQFPTKGRKIFVMGDMKELGEAEVLLHEQVGLQAKDACDMLVAVGRLSRHAVKAARKSGFDVGSLFTCDSCQQAHKVLVNDIDVSKDDVILVKGSRSMKMEELFSYFHTP
jgi:UDP-N-acetylmuramoyl-tripeptide--D-alanyl-D-alanine ligase